MNRWDTNKVTGRGHPSFYSLINKYFLFMQETNSIVTVHVRNDWTAANKEKT